MVVASLIERKRRGESLTASEWRDLLQAYNADAVPDYQMAALLMAVFFRGLTAEELYAVTDTMVQSGASLSFDGWDTPRVGKHSTGGVGDKTSIVLAPLLACCDVAVPKLSGRGLGHTGGTLDKLESIPGFRTGLSLEEAEQQVRTLGCALLGQSSDFAPIDRKLYGLRNVTATFESWEFRWAYVVRYAHDYGLLPTARDEMLQASLASSRQEHRFFVSLIGFDFRESNLVSKQSAWRVLLVDPQGNQAVPVLMERVRRPFPYLAACSAWPPYSWPRSGCSPSAWLCSRSGCCRI